MESKESARLKEIDSQLRRIELQLREQNKQLRRIADIFDKQWHGNGDLFTVTPFCGPAPPIVKAVELEKGDTNETEE